MTPEDIRLATKAVSDWVRIRDRPDYNAPLTPAEVEHSALLRRLLGGKPALPDPPPRSFSYPWYELIEDGRSTCECWEMTAEQRKVWGRTEPTLVVNQSPTWTILRKEGEAFIVTNPRAPGEWRVRPGTDEEIDLAGILAGTASGIAWDVVNASSNREAQIEGIIEGRRKWGWRIERNEEVLQALDQQQGQGALRRSAG